MNPPKTARSAARTLIRRLLVLAALAALSTGAGCFSKKILEGPPERGTVRILTEPEGGVVTFDGARRGAAYKARPLVMKGVVYGHHSARAEFPLRVATVVEFDLDEKTKTLRIPMEKNSFGRLTIRVSPPGAEVFIDSRYYGKATSQLDVNGLAFGEHSVWVRSKGYRMRRQSVFVERQAHRIYEIFLKPER